VGLTERQARENGIDVGVARCRVGDVAGSTVTGIGVDGGVHVVIDRARDVVVGATITGPDVGDMIHCMTVSVAGEVPLDRLRHSVPSFPSLSEVWQRALESYDDEEAR
jgi:pyruvate/2-oxoglutarate dehydrogenase complex dihydrolipoamide dehydrogenase (E3) component